MNDMVTEKEILEELQGLDPTRWSEVQDFIAYLKYRSAQRPAQEHARPMTGRTLHQLGLLGLWADREDIGDSSTFARKLRSEAERRKRTGNDSA
jgi:hypothetical protein